MEEHLQRELNSPILGRAHTTMRQLELIKKLAHGRVSKTKDGAIQLTLKVFFHEGLNICLLYTSHRLIYVHGGERRNIEAREPHISYDGDERS